MSETNGFLIALLQGSISLVDGHSAIENGPSVLTLRLTVFSLLRQSCSLPDFEGRGVKAGRGESGSSACVTSTQLPRKQLPRVAREPLHCV